MIENKCCICNNAGYVYINGYPLCLSHCIKEYWKNAKGCLESYLDTFIDRLVKNNKLDRDELEFLRALRMEMPEMVDEFPILFNELKKY